jgi:GNAT superfamily N-acetyltransferase
MIVRVAVPAERLDLIELQRRASLANPGDRDAILAHPEAVDTPVEQFEALQVLVAEDAGSHLGFAAVIPRDDGDAELDALFVEPDLWRGGVGRALVGACVAHARRDGARILHVIGNPHADGFYRTVGFVPADPVQTEFGPASRYELALD